MRYLSDINLKHLQHVTPLPRFQFQDYKARRPTLIFLMYSDDILNTVHVRNYAKKRYLIQKQVDGFLHQQLNVTRSH